MVAIFKRELRSYFTSPIGYIFLAVMYFLGGMYFSVSFAGGSADLGFVFLNMFSTSLTIIPLLTMRLLSEEKRQKTDQLLLTAPITTTSVVLGKYFASLAMYVLGSLATFLYLIVICTFVQPDFNVFLGNYLGFVLAGGSLLSIGLFVSALTENQVVSAIISYVIMGVISIYDYLIVGLPDSMSWLTDFLFAISFMSRFNDFSNGILDLTNLFYYLSVSAVFIFVCAKTIERKRWC